jgi:hypothetical protein
MGDEYRAKIEEKCHHGGVFNKSTSYDISIEVSGPGAFETEKLSIQAQASTSPDFRDISTFRAKGR